MDKNKIAEIVEKLTGISVKLSKIQNDVPAESKISTKDGKELSFTGELKEGVELKFNDTALENGTYQLSDERTIVVEDGKLVKFEAVEGDKNAEIVELKATIESQKKEIESLKVEFKSVLEGAKETLSAVEKIALAMEGEKKPAAGSEGSEMISKAEWIVKRATKAE